ncbi:MAG TPA: hypothetical protein VL981_08950 [Candidatus Methylacidiphilales bacterium]|nr:hypothetical protein [Candidatus Methylacidiphilales bacterium]
MKKPSLLRILLTTVACLAFGGALFGLGYWQGGRAAHLEMAAQIARQMNSPPGNFGRFGGPPMPFMPRQIHIPPNASPEMKEFLQNQQTLQQKMAQLRSQNNGVPAPQLFAQFRQENADLLKRQSELSQAIAKQRAQNPLPLPPPLQIPPNASPQLQAYLTARDQLMRDQMAFMNQHRADDSMTRQAAMQQWRQQNAPRFQQLQQLAQAASPHANAAASAIQSTNTVSKSTTTN